MSSKQASSKTIFIVGLSTVVGFFVWLFLLFSFWILLKIFGFNPNLNSLIEAMSTALATAAVIGAAFIAIRQLSETSQSRYMEVADKLFSELNSPGNIEARRIIYQNLHNGKTKKSVNLTDEEKTAIKTVLNSLDKVAFLTQSGWIPEGLVMPWMHPMVAKSWEKLEPYVVHERKTRNEDYYYQNVSKLAEICEKWRKKNLKEAKIKWVDKAI